MSIERSTAKGFPRSRGAKLCTTCAVIVGNVALRRSADPTVNSGAINIWLLLSQDLVAASAALCNPRNLRIVLLVLIQPRKLLPQVFYFR